MVRRNINMPYLNPRCRTLFAGVLVLVGALVALAPAQNQTAPAGAASWKFAVSGDSRNCGDIVMPAIAEGALKDGAAFYWHLGDYRAIYMFDEDYARLNPQAAISDYESAAWPDFINHQLKPFGDLPVFLAIGNHELIQPKTHNEVIAQFADWFDSPVVRRQRLADNPDDHLVKTYYHWIDRGVDFITLDNAGPDQFDSDQMTWFAAELKRAAANPAIRTVVIGMHAALPDSTSAGHSMNDSQQEQFSGRLAYNALTDFRRTTHKNVYVMASHSHFVMNNIYATSCHAKDNVLPGWIVGSAGAVRYRLPKDLGEATIAKTDMYGYVLATVAPDDTITFEFRPVEEKAVPKSVNELYGKEQVRWCFAQNKSTYMVPGATCPITCCAR
jgi:calcineurin-like phosphoesterase family protein